MAPLASQSAAGESGPTLLTVDLFAIVGDLEPRIYSVFFVVLAIWIGVARTLEPTTAKTTVGLIVVVLGEFVNHVVHRLREASVVDELTAADCAGSRAFGRASRSSAWSPSPGRATGGAWLPRASARTRPPAG